VQTKQNTILVITSLLTILFTTFHLADDIVRGMSPGGPGNMLAVLFWVIWLYGTLILGERRSGLIIMLIGSLLSSAIPVIHMTNKTGAVSPRIAASLGAFFFAWTLLAIAVSSVFSIILSVRELWPRRGAE
jgi:hypothetical protein